MYHVRVQGGAATQAAPITKAPTKAPTPAPTTPPSFAPTSATSASDVTNRPLRGRITEISYIRDGQGFYRNNSRALYPDGSIVYYYDQSANKIAYAVMTSQKVWYDAQQFPIVYDSAGNPTKYQVGSFTPYYDAAGEQNRSSSQTLCIHHS